MAVIDDTAIGIADVYARSLFDLAAAGNAVDGVAGEFGELIELIDAQPDVATFMTSEAIDVDRRAETLEKLFRGQLGDLLLNTLLVINGKGRLSLIREIHSAFARLREEQQNRVDATVTTATALNDEQRQRVIDSIGERTGKQVTLHEQVDAEILGGLVVQVGDERLDGSVASRLGRIERSLHERASQELLALRESAVEGA